MDFMVDMEEYPLFEDLGDSLLGLSAPEDEQNLVAEKSFPGDGLISHKLVIDQAGHDALEDLLQLSNDEGNLKIFREIFITLCY